MNSERGLLLDTLHRNESHGRTADRLADRLRVAAVVLVALQIRLHIRRRHQSHLMAITADHPRPVVRGTTSLNSHGAWRKLREELLHRATPKLATQHNGSPSINSVNLKHVLRQIQTNCANLAHGRLPCLEESTSPVWHTDAVGGRPPHHVWTAPCRQGFFGVSANGSGSGHVYGLEMRPVAAGPDGERGSNSNHCGALLRAMTARSVSIPVS